MRRRIPATLLVALILTAIVDLVYWLWIMRARDEGASWAQMRVFGPTLWMAHIAVLPAGILALRDLVAPAGRARVAVIAGLAMVGLEAVELAMSLWTESHSSERVEHLMRDLLFVREWIGPFLALALIVAIASLGARRDRPWTIAATVALGALQLLRYPPPFLRDVLHFDLTGDRQWFAMTMILVPELIVNGGALLLARRGISDGGVGWQPARRGLERAAVALAARVIIAIALVPALLLFGLQSRAMVELLVVAVPAASAVLGMVAAAGMFVASRADPDGAPRLRLALSGYATAWVAAVDGVVALAMWSAFSHHDGFEMAGLGLTWVQPAVSLFGVLAYLSALGAISHRTANQLRSEQLLAAGAGMTIVIGGGAWLARGLGELDSLPTIVMVSLALSVIAILSILKVVALTRAVVAGLDAQPAVPIAVARDAR